MARNQRSAENTTGSPFSVDTGESVLIAIQHSAIHFLKRHHQGGQIQPPLSGLFFVKADVGYFRIGIGTPRNDQSARFLTTEEERVLQHHARRGISDMGELVRRADIAGRVNASIRGAQLIVNLDTSVIKGDPSSVEVKTF